MRSMEDVRFFFSQPNIGSVETAAAPGRHLIRHLIPNIREVVILRPVDEVVGSMMNLDVSDVAQYDRATLKKGMEYGDRILRKIARESHVLTVDYSDLGKRDTCIKIFEHCLPYSFDEKWWDSLHNQNIQVNVKDVLLYYFKHKSAIEGFKKHCKSELRRLYRSSLTMQGGM